MGTYMTVNCTQVGKYQKSLCERRPIFCVHSLSTSNFFPRLLKRGAPCRHRLLKIIGQKRDAYFLYRDLKLVPTYLNV
jgi:hypothetical protein